MSVIRYRFLLIWNLSLLGKPGTGLFTLSFVNTGGLNHGFTENNVSAQHENRSWCIGSHIWLGADWPVGKIRAKSATSIKAYTGNVIRVGIVSGFKSVG